MSDIKVMDLPTTCSFSLGSDRVMGYTTSGQRQSSARLRSSKAGTVSLANVGEAGPPWHGIEDKHACRHCDFQGPGCWQRGDNLRGGMVQYCAT